MAFNSHTAGPDTGHAATALTSLSKMAHGFVSILVRFMSGLVFARYLAALHVATRRNYQPV